MLIEALGVEEAIARAEQEAERYAGLPVIERNHLGERLVHTYLGACNAFSISERPGDGVEVFSSIRLCRRGSEGSVVEVLLGSDRAPGDEERWRRFEPYGVD